MAEYGDPGDPAVPDGNSLLISERLREGVCAVIVTHECGTSVEKTFQSIVEQVDRVLLVDNGSGQGTLRILDSLISRFPEKAELLRSDENQGVAAALNRGSRRAVSLGFPWVLTLDHDSIAERGMVERLLRSWNARRDREIVKIAAPRYVDVNALFETRYPVYRGIWPKFLRFTDAAAVLEPMEVITSGSLVRTDVFDSVGFFRDDMFIDYVDIEFCLRVCAAGFKIIVPGDAFLFHELGKATEARIFGKKFITLNHSPLRQYYIARNRTFVARKYGRSHPSLLLFSVREMIVDIVRIVLLEEGAFEKCSRMMKGIRDGVSCKM
jgi:rhamnosyltransferase